MQDISEHFLNFAIEELLRVWQKVFRTTPFKLSHIGGSVLLEQFYDAVGQILRTICYKSRRGTSGTPTHFGYATKRY